MRRRDPPRPAPPRAYRSARRARRNAEAIRALGMGPHISAIWSAHNEKYLTDQVGASDVAVTYGTLSKVLRLMLQSAVLGLGAYLVIIGEATGGVMIAASILVSRALAPIEIAIANWRGFLAARQSAERLSKLLQSLPIRPEAMELPTAGAELRGRGALDRSTWPAEADRAKRVVLAASR